MTIYQKMNIYHITTNRYQKTLYHISEMANTKQITHNRQHITDNIKQRTYINNNSPITDTRNN